MTFSEQSLDAYLNLSARCNHVAWLYEQSRSAQSDQTEGKEARREGLEAEYVKQRELLASDYHLALKAGAPQADCNALLLKLLPEDTLKSLEGGNHVLA